jgi:hypothetical protein
MTYQSQDPAPETVHDIDAGRTRQARWGRHAFIVLVVSLALIVVGFGVLHGFFMKPLADKNGNASAPQAAQAFNGPPPQPRWSDAGGVTGHSPPPSQSEPSATSPS